MKKLSFDAPDEVVKIIDQLRERGDFASDAQILSSALTLYNAVSEAAADGYDYVRVNFHNKTQQQGKWVRAHSLNRIYERARVEERELLTPSGKGGIP